MALRAPEPVWLNSDPIAAAKSPETDPLFGAEADARYRELRRRLTEVP